MSPCRPSTAPSRTALPTGLASLRAEAFPQRLCRAGSPQMRASVISATSSSWACESQRSSQRCGNPCCALISIPLAAQEARLPHVSVTSGDVLRTRDDACIARACCDYGSLLCIVQASAFCFAFSVFFLSLGLCCCKLAYECCVVRFALQPARRGGHSAPT